MSKKWIPMYNNSLENFNEEKNKDKNTSFKKFLNYLSIQRMPYEKVKHNNISITERKKLLSEE